MNELPIDKLGPYPLLQLTAALIVLAGLALAVYRGSRDKPGAAALPANEQRWFFDGPLAIAVNLLRDLRNHLERLVEIAGPAPEEQRKQSELLREIRDTQREIKEAIENLPSQRRQRR